MYKKITAYMRKPRRISIQTIEENSTSYAIYKARRDVDRIVASCGYEPLVFGSRSPIGLYRVLKRHYDICSLKWRIRRDDTVFFQFPWIHNNRREFYANLFASGAKVSCVIHDIDSLRTNDSGQTTMETDVLRQCDMVIAHTPAMKRWLVGQGVDERRIEVLNVFGYITDTPLREVGDLGDATIVFAGNMAKSPFVKLLHNVAGDNVKYHIYGNITNDFRDSECVIYKGSFAPEHPEIEEGNWGLVWDGDRTDTCNGLVGNYLRYNSSHKIALYLALGLPVIVWSESSLRDFIVGNGLGIAVDSLDRIAETVAGLSAEERRTMVERVRDFAQTVRSGDTISRIVARNN